MLCMGSDVLPGGTDRANCTGPGWLVGAQPHRHGHRGSKRVAGLWHTELWAQGWKSGVLALLSEPWSPFLLKATPVVPRSLPCDSGDRDCMGRAREVPAKMTGSGITRKRTQMRTSKPGRFCLKTPTGLTFQGQEQMWQDHKERGTPDKGAGPCRAVGAPGDMEHTCLNHPQPSQPRTALHMASVSWGAASPWVGNTGGDHLPAGPFMARDAWNRTPWSSAGRSHEAPNLPFWGKATDSSSKGCVNSPLISSSQDLAPLGSGSHESTFRAGLPPRK